MERFRILFRVLPSSMLVCVVYVFLRGFAYVLRCCLGLCCLPFASRFCANVRVRICVCGHVCVLKWLVVSMLDATPSNSTFVLVCVNAWSVSVFAWGGCQG